MQPVPVQKMVFSVGNLPMPVCRTSAEVLYKWLKYNVPSMVYDTSAYHGLQKELRILLKGHHQFLPKTTLQVNLK